MVYGFSGCLSLYVIYDGKVCFQMPNLDVLRICLNKAWMSLYIERLAKN